MKSIIGTMGIASLLVGLAWILQSLGLWPSALLASQPVLVVSGAAVAGLGAGLLMWKRTAP